MPAIRACGPLCYSTGLQERLNFLLLGLSTDDLSNYKSKQEQARIGQARRKKIGRGRRTPENTTHAPPTCSSVIPNPCFLLLARASTKSINPWPNPSLMHEGSGCNITQANTQATNLSIKLAPIKSVHGLIWMLDPRIIGCLFSIQESASFVLSRRISNRLSSICLSKQKESIKTRQARMCARRQAVGRHFPSRMRALREPTCRRVPLAANP
ncbi:hypothetical protein SEVIR_5G408933v4 [Setaria viridis]